MEKEEELFIPKTKHKALKICLAILLIAGLIVGGYFLYQYKFNNSKTIINNILEDAKEEINNSFKDYKPNGIYKIDGHVNFDSNISDETFQIVKDIEAQLTGEMDVTNRLSNYQINTKYKGDKLLAVNFYQEKDIVYFLLDGLYDKYLKVEINEQEEAIPSVSQVVINPSDVKIILDSMITSLKEVVMKQDIKKADAKITIDGKEVNVLNHYIELKDKEFNNFVKEMVNSLKNNKTFVETFNKMLNTDVNEAFDELLKGIDEEEYKGIYKLSFYTDKGLFNKKLVSIRQSINQDGVLVTASVDKISDDEIELSISQMGISYTARVKLNSSVINLSLGMNAMGQYLNINCSINYEEIKEVSKIDVSNSKDASELTEDEKKEIEAKLKDNKALLKLAEEINKINKKEA